MVQVLHLLRQHGAIDRGGLHVELAEVELEVGVFYLLPSFSTPILDSEACSAISSDQNEGLMLSASGAEELYVGRHEAGILSKLFQSVAFGELLGDVTCTLARLNLGQMRSKRSSPVMLVNHFLDDSSFIPLDGS